MANQAYDRGLAVLADYDWTDDVVDLGVMLVQNTYSFVATENTIAELVSHETSGTGYGRRAIAAIARTRAQASGEARLIVANSTVLWTALNAGTGLTAVVFFVTGTGLSDDANDLFGHYDTGTNLPIATNGQDVTFDFNALGAVRLRRV